MDHRDERRGPLLVGVVLVVVGIVVLAAQASGLDIGWPAWIVIPGLAIFIVALAVGGPGGAGFAALGGIVTSVGLVFAAQEATGAYASWAYAWALVAPGGVGAGLFLYGLLTGQLDIARGGLAALVAGVAIFLVGYLFFEGVLHLDGIPTGSVANLVIPGALVVLGLLVIVGAFLPRRWWGAERGWGSAPGGPAGAPAGQGPSAGPVAPASGLTPPSTQPGPTAAGASGPASAGHAGIVAPASSSAGVAASAAAPSSTSDARSIDLDGASSGEIVLGFGAGRLAVTGAAAPGHLLDGVFTGGVNREDRGPASVRLTTPGDAFWGRIWSGRAPFDWRVGLSAEIPLRLGLEVGAARTEADLSALRVTDLRIKTGAAETDVTLPAAAGYTRAEIEAGAASVRVRVPAGVAARIRSTVALGSTEVDTARFPRDPLGGWVSPEYGGATNRVDIEIRGGVGSVAIR